MFNVTFVLYEQPGRDRQDALRYWRTTHADLVRQVPGVQRYVQQHAVAAPQGEPPFLGIATLSFADEGAFAAAGSSQQFGAAVADVGNFADPERLPTAFVEEILIVG